MEGTATDERIAVQSDREVANVFGHLELGARQHDPICRVSVDYSE
jgi:hypothetical protein